MFSSSCALKTLQLSSMATAFGAFLPCSLALLVSLLHCLLVFLQVSLCQQSFNVAAGKAEELLQLSCPTFREAFSLGREPKRSLLLLHKLTTPRTFLFKALYTETKTPASSVWSTQTPSPLQPSLQTWSNSSSKASCFPPGVTQL